MKKYKKTLVACLAVSAFTLVGSAAASVVDIYNVTNQCEVSKMNTPVVVKNSGRDIQVYNGKTTVTVKPSDIPTKVSTVKSASANFSFSFTANHPYTSGVQVGNTAPKALYIATYTDQKTCSNAGEGNAPCFIPSFDQNPCG